MNGELPHYYFIPAVREGLAAFISASAEHERAVVEATLTPIIDGTPDPSSDRSVRVGLYGPGDVVGFDPSVVARTDPRAAGCWDYEANFLPAIEFFEPDFPWRFTPNVAQSRGLQPWITLIVLEESEYDGLAERMEDADKPGTLPVRWIKQAQLSALPDLASAWRWAHVQVTAEDSLSDTQLKDVISGASGSPEGHVVARLLCPRRLADRTRYTAFVVPTFKIGQVAAGLPVTLGASENALTHGWQPAASGTIDLPYYYKWDFATAAHGDFEYLVRLLQPRELSELGRRPIDCANLPYGLPPTPGDGGEAAEVLQLEGALKPATMEPSRWQNETTAIAAFRQELAAVLNLAAAQLPGGPNAGDSGPRKVVPPIFGRRHARQQTANAADTTSWMNDLNLDPRRRAAAGFGTLVVTKQQEALMAGVWDQLGDIEIANQALFFGQLGLEASIGLYERLNLLSMPDFLWTTSPLFGRVLVQTPGAPAVTMATSLEASPIPSSAFDPAFRRVLRRGGRIRRLQGDVVPPKGRDILSRLNARDIAAASVPPQLEGMPSMCAVTDAAVTELERQAEPQRQAQNRYRVNGRILDGARRPIVGARVTCWDRDPFFTDKLGDAVTNDRGAFRIEFDDSYFGERFLDRRPDLQFKVERNGRDLTLVPPAVLRNVQPGDTSVVLQVRDAGEAVEGRFVIEGRVIDRATGTGVAWLTVEAWDRDPRFHDLLATTMTAEQGEFRVAFDNSYFAERPLDRLPDVYFKVLHAGRQIEDTLQSVIRDLPVGRRAVTIEVDAPSPRPSAPSGPRVFDFCEDAITPDSLEEAVAAGGAELEVPPDVVRAISTALRDWLGARDAPPEEKTPADLPALKETMAAASAPWITIPARLQARLQVDSSVHSEGLLGRLESEVDFPQPMYEPLAKISQDLILPGVNTVPQNTLSLLTTNRAFMEAYMLGLNDALGAEVVWRGAPVYPWTSFFRQFWDTSGLIEPSADPNDFRDISRLSTWPAGSALGSHPATAAGPLEQAVLLVRGDVLKRYPNTLVYAVPAVLVLGEEQPALEEFVPAGQVERVWPIFSGSLAPDLTFLGFDKSPAELCAGGPNERGYFIVLEERLGQPRFGFNLTGGDENSESRWWYDLTWSELQPTVAEHSYINGAAPPGASTRTPRWATSSATTANICLQRPVRLAVHASKMLPPSACE